MSNQQLSAGDLYHEIGEPVQQFITQYCRDEYRDLLEQYPREKQSLWIDWQDLATANQDLAEDLLEPGYFETFQALFERALLEMPNPLPEVPQTQEFEQVTVRFYNLPDWETYAVGEYRSGEAGSLVSIQGQISKISGVKGAPSEIAFECQRCGTLTHIPQHTGETQEPGECSGCHRSGPYRMRTGQSTFQDQMLVQLDQPVEQAAVGRDESLKVYVTDDLEAWFTEHDLDAGARITITGLLEYDESSESNGAYPYQLQANSMELEDEQYETIDTSEYQEEIEALADDPALYDRLINSLAPDIIGGEKMRTIKLAILMLMFGGYRRQKPDGDWIRGDPHGLLIGDPSTGKSTLMDAVKDISPRAMKASGKGASAAGMTAAAVRDSDFGDGQYTLEAGALALANDGVACIDEISRMQDDAVNSMHEAMEQQEISVSKGGINATLPARTTVLAGGNPKYDRFDPHESVISQIELDPALFSRFDWIFTLRDEPHEELDAVIASTKTQLWQESARVDRGELDAGDAATAPAIDHDLLRAYIAHAKQSVQPYLSDGAAERIEEYYTSIRQQAGDAVPLSARKLPAINRLSEAAARMRLSETIEEEDVERALGVVGQSLADVGMNELGEFDADIVETGRSTPQRERARGLSEIIRELEDEFEDGAPVEEVVGVAGEELGISASKVEHRIEGWKESGELYEPVTGRVRFT